MRTMAWTVMALVAIGAAGAAPPPKIKYYGSGKERRALNALHGKPAFELEQVEWKQGGPLTLAGLRGKVVLLDFTAQW